jgi:hypothetical protein
MREYEIALHKILNLAQHGTPPDYTRWLTVLDEIALIAREALKLSDGDHCKQLARRALEGK